MAIFEFDKRTELYGLWAYGADGDFDCLGMVFREDASAPWIARWRFRHHAADKLWDSEDRKNVFQVVADPTLEARDKLWTAMRATVEAAASAMGETLDDIDAEFIVINGTSEALAGVLQNLKCLRTEVKHVPLSGGGPEAEA